MVGILIVAHGAFGEALIHCASHVLGKRPLRVRQLDSGQGVLILTDILGATPSNIGTRLLKPGKVEGASGASLPMLIRALTYRDGPLASVVDKAVSGGCEGVVKLSADVSHAASRS